MIVEAINKSYTFTCGVQYTPEEKLVPFTNFEEVSNYGNTGLTVGLCIPCFGRSLLDVFVNNQYCVIVYIYTVYLYLQYISVCNHAQWDTKIDNMFNVQSTRAVYQTTRWRG